ncbi:MAG: protein translocase subunit SecD, partial [Boseongicola sp.]
MLQIAAWKRVLIWVVCLTGLLFAFPNGFYTRVEQHNDAVAEIEVLGSTPEREAAAGGWPDLLPATLVNLGLDLRGGAHLLAEVQVEDVYSDRMDGYWIGVRDALVAVRDQIGFVERIPDAPNGELHVRISQADGMPTAIEAVRAIAQPVVSVTAIGAFDIVVSGQGDRVIVALSDDEKRATDSRTIQQSLEIIRRRVDEVGTREPTIQRQGVDRILIQVPGIGSAEELKRLIGTTARLTFHPVVSAAANSNSQAGPGELLVQDLEDKDQFY